jgi:ribosomal protein S18 acetylase RimI-like enzyme
MALKIVYGGEAGLPALTAGFNRGFRDYKYAAEFDTDRMIHFLHRSGIEAENCAVLLAQEGGHWRGAGVALLALEGDESWCGGLAVASEYRRQGWGRRLMQAIQSKAAEHGARSLLLEVLYGNEAAQQLYRGMGYQFQRELLIWERPARRGTLPVPYERLEPADPRQVIDEYHAWHDLPPCWQRRASFLRRNALDMRAFTISAKDGLPVGYVLFQKGQDPKTGREYVRIFDVATDPAADVLMAGRPLLQALQIKFMDADLILINEPVDSKLNRVFAALGFYVRDRQYEMRLSLSGSDILDPNIAQ